MPPKSKKKASLGPDVQMYIDSIMPDLFQLMKKFNSKITKAQVQSRLVSDWNTTRTFSERDIFSEKNRKLPQIQDIILNPKEKLPDLKEKAQNEAVNGNYF